MTRVRDSGGHVSQYVRDLVETVERLGAEDQDRILRIVTLLALAPARVQNATQQMLRELLESKPATARDCIEQVDEVIDYLEDSIASNGLSGDSFSADARSSFELASRPPPYRLN